MLLAGVCALLAGCAPEAQNEVIGGADNATGIVVADGVDTVASTDHTLIFVDDKEITKEEFNAIKVEDIESFTVLKDSAAVQIYGERGKDGVVLIKMKKKEKP